METGSEVSQNPPGIVELPRERETREREREKRYYNKQ